MKRFNAVFPLALLSITPLQAQPAGTGVGAHLAYVANDAATGSDFDENIRGELFGQLRFNPRLAFELGYAHSTSTEEQGVDNTGTYSIDITSDDFYGGVRLQSQAIGAWSLYGRGGLLYYRSEIDFAEEFFGLKPGGEIEEIEEGIGYYLEAGVSYAAAPELLLDLGFTYRVRQDYFEDSRRPFDLEEMGVTAGLVWLLR